jgi:hypothetical protein
MMYNTSPRPHACGESSGHFPLQPVKRWKIIVSSCSSSAVTRTLMYRIFPKIAVEDVRLREGPVSI